MINFQELDAYKEGNRLEVKKSSKGLPKSIWETYSSFANTLGGVILLGITVQKPRSRICFVTKLIYPKTRLS